MLRTLYCSPPLLQSEEPCSLPEYSVFFLDLHIPKPTIDEYNNVKINMCLNNAAPPPGKANTLKNDPTEETFLINWGRASFSGTILFNTCTSVSAMAPTKKKHTKTQNIIKPIIGTICFFKYIEKSSIIFSSSLVYFTTKIA